MWMRMRPPSCIRVCVCVGGGGGGSNTCKIIYFIFCPWVWSQAPVSQRVAINRTMDIHRSSMANCVQLAINRSLRLIATLFWNGALETAFSFLIIIMCFISYISYTYQRFEVGWYWIILCSENNTILVLYNIMFLQGLPFECNKECWGAC